MATTCGICGREIDQLDSAYRRVAGWEPPDVIVDVPMLVEETGEYAHAKCVETSPMPRGGG